VDGDGNRSAATGADTASDTAPSSNGTAPAEDRDGTDELRTPPWTIDLGYAPELLTTTPSRDGLYGDLSRGPSVAFEFDGRERWTVDEVGTALWAIDDDHAYLDSRIDGESGVTAVSTDTGAVQWQYPTPGPRARLWEVRATRDRVYLLSQQGGGEQDPPDEWFARLHALNPTDGQHLWQREFPHYGRGWQLFAVGDRALLAWQRGRIHLLDPDGTELWRRWLPDDPPGTARSARYVSHTLRGVAASRDRILFGDNTGTPRNDHRVVALRLSDGSTDWETGGFEAIGPVRDDLVLCHRSEGGWTRLGALETGDGVERWSERLDDRLFPIWGRPFESTAYVSTLIDPRGPIEDRTASVLALDTATGGVIATYDRPGGVVTEPIVTADTVYVGTGVEEFTDEGRVNEGELHGIPLA